jgi:indolepyruvate ferredoxin oxidoreductase beta subunit
MSEKKCFGSVPNTGSTDLKLDIIVCGVGGQGTILASDILGRAAVAEGCAVQAAETHGMAQRGGTVENHVRIGSVYGALIPGRTADLMIALEPSDAVRYAHLMKDGAVIVVDTEPILPFTVTTGKAEYPPVDKMLAALSENFDVRRVNGTEIAVGLGNRLVVNAVMMGAASHFIPFPEQTFINSLKASVPPKHLDLNLAAFEAGRKSIQP